MSLFRAIKSALFGASKPKRPRRTKGPLPHSRSLRQAPGDPALLASLGLPKLMAFDDVVRWTGLALPRLVQLMNVRNDCHAANYVEWTVPKRGGGQRVIAAPKPELRAIQRKINREILAHVAVHESAHGFLPQRNIVTNAQPHVGRSIVVKADLDRFFEYIRHARVIGVFRWLGYDLAVARTLALLCTHRTVVRAPRAGGWPSYIGPKRHAVPGAPTSPALSNLVLHRLDRRLEGLARKFEGTYTRYADDLTLSGDESLKRGLSRFIPLVRRIVKDEGFRLNDRKLRFARSGYRQEVTGVVVNQKVNVRRAEFDRLKAILHNARQAGSLTSQNRDGHADFRRMLAGRIGHVLMLAPQKGRRLLSELARIPD